MEEEETFEIQIIRRKLQAKANAPFILNWTMFCFVFFNILVTVTFREQIDSFVA